jgi:hypothetical protein
VARRRRFGSTPPPTPQRSRSARAPGGGSSGAAAAARPCAARGLRCCGRRPRRTWLGRAAAPRRRPGSRPAQGQTGHTVSAGGFPLLGRPAPLFFASLPLATPPPPPPPSAIYQAGGEAPGGRGTLESAGRRQRAEPGCAHTAPQPPTPPARVLPGVRPSVSCIPTPALRGRCLHPPNDRQRTELPRSHIHLTTHQAQEDFFFFFFFFALCQLSDLWGRRGV